jgi:hypothetical protein
LQRIGGDPHDDGRLPRGEAGQHSGIGSHDGRFPHPLTAKDINALVAFAGLERIIPQIADQSIGGHKEGGTGRAVDASFYGPVWVGGGVAEPFQHARGASDGTLHTQENVYPHPGGNAKDQDREQPAFIHGTIIHAPQSYERDLLLDS